MPTGAPNVPWSPILTRLNPFYPGQYGVPGTDNTTGLRLGTDGKILYVDPNHVDANDNRDGTDPTSPLATVAAAIALCRAYMNDVIIVAPSSFWQYGNTAVGRATPILEEVTLDVPGVRLVGLAPAGTLGVYWGPVTDNGVCIDVTAVDCLIEGFAFWDDDGLTSPVAIRAQWDAPPYGDSLTVRNCFFDGSLGYGIRMDYSWWNHIYDNVFENIDVAAIDCMNVEGSSDYNYIHDNVFTYNIVAMQMDSCNECFICNNVINGTPTGTDNFIDLANGSGNIVANNWLACSIAQYDVTCDGGNAGGTLNAWINNHCIDGDPVAIPAG